MTPVKTCTCEKQRETLTDLHVFEWRVRVVFWIATRWECASLYSRFVAKKDDGLLLYAVLLSCLMCLCDVIVWYWTPTKGFDLFVFYSRNFDRCFSECCRMQCEISLLCLLYIYLFTNPFFILPTSCRTPYFPRNSKKFRKIFVVKNFFPLIFVFELFVFLDLEVEKLII